MKKKFLIFFASLLVLTSCNDYLDINNSTNNPHASDIQPSALLAAALSSTYRTQAISMNEYGSVMMNGWGANVNAWTGGYTTEYTMNFTTSTRSAIWDGLYLNVNNFQNIINFPNDGTYDNYVAISKIMKSYYMAYIVDLYGNAPYSQAFKGQGNLRPTYDDDVAIYKDLLMQLDDARALIANPSSMAELPDAQDVVFLGDMTAWTAFANTVELKLCLRMSEVTDPALVAIRDARIAALSGVTFVSSNVVINPGYSGGTAAQNNPFYSVWGPNQDGTSAGTQRTFTCASQYLAKTLMGTQSNSHLVSTGVIDTRRGRIFSSISTTSTNIVGVNQGDVTAAAGGTAPPSLSRIGYGQTGYTGFSASEAYDNGASKDGYLMLASESSFLQAEAAFRYPSTFGGNAQDLFTQGITDSYAHYSLPVGTITPAVLNAAPYIAASNSKMGIGWDGTPNKLEAIMTQKWIALHGIHGIEPLLDNIRTGFPANPLAITAAHPNRPKRLLYPQSEYTSNSANVPNVSLADIFSVNQFSPFWVR